MGGWGCRPQKKNHALRSLLTNFCGLGHHARGHPFSSTATADKYDNTFTCVIIVSGLVMEAEKS
jgi:hypothetical protein